MIIEWNVLQLWLMSGTDFSIVLTSKSMSLSEARVKYRCIKIAMKENNPNNVYITGEEKKGKKQQKLKRFASNYSFVE